jgi:drug/metabolite transporter (DMT)-like permease
MKYRLLRNPFFHIFLCALFATTAEVFLKLGARETAHLPSAIPWLGLTGLTSKWIWASIVFTLLSFGAWMQAISILPLSVAFTLSNVVHVLIPLSCWAFLGEAISPMRWLGITLVVTGLLLIAKPFANIDKRL